MKLRVANGAGFLGDNLDAPRRVVADGTVDVLTLEYLAELTLSILARVREKNPKAGYAGDFIDVLPTLAPALKQQSQLRVITNAGGMNPQACAIAAAGVLQSAGLGELPIGVVTGDDLLGHISQLSSAGWTFPHFDTGQPLSELGAPLVSANAYLGAPPLVDALRQGARLLITGRVADASLTVAPVVECFGWAWDDWNRLAGASVAGHVIECGAQCTGGFYTHWNELPWGTIGYPIAEIDASGEATFSLPSGAAGCVNRETVAEQLVYEIGDPAHYLTPDVDVDFRSVTLAQTAPNQVRVSGARGASPPPTLKVSMAYKAGFTASGQLLVYGRHARQKAQACADAILARLHDAGAAPGGWNVELLGTGCGVPGRPISVDESQPSEIMLRVTVHDLNRDKVERFTKEIAPLITSGPAGLAGYAAGRASVRPVLAYWPTTIPRELVAPRAEVRPAREWLSG